MSSGGRTPPVIAPPEWRRLEETVRGLLAEHDQVQKRLRQAEARTRTLEEALRRIAGGDLDPTRIAARLRTLEEENRRLRERLDQGRAIIERAMARLEFLEQSR